MDHVDAASAVQSSDQEHNGFSPMPYPCHQKNEPSLEVERKNTAANSSSKSARKGKKVYAKMIGRRYNLRSSLDGVRVLRSMANSKAKTPVKSFSPPVNPVTERKIKRKKVKRISSDELSLGRKRVRYLLTRMNYEQSLIDAYSGEGWRGQSQEKIKPEKELERAKAEIVRCKLKIRDLFRYLDSLSSEGRFQDSLFDSEGQISSEDIFCAKCGSKNVLADNDIILCDGICDRGFHQKCLEPPLLSEDIPAGDEGWLCPSCDCKVDCLNILNEFQGSDLGIENTWEEVFPEAAATANGDKRYDETSDDSEDNDYDPNAPDVESEDRVKKSVSDESEDSGDQKRDNHCHDLGFPSDDSEDDDYGPDDPEPTRKAQKDGSTSDESDFTSDSDEFCDELRKTLSSNRTSGTSSSKKSLEHLRGGEHVRDTSNSRINSKRLSPLVSDLNQENVLPVSAKRQFERLDYKKLYDEAYSKTSSDSSDDEEWSGVGAQKQANKDEFGKESTGVERKSPRIIASGKGSNGPKSRLTEDGTKSDLDKGQVSQVVRGNAPKVHSNGDAKSIRENGSQKVDSNGGSKSTSSRKNYGKITSQKLLDALRENQYPSRAEKESLAEELGLAFQQVDKWFGNARHNMRESAKASQQALITTDTGVDNDANQSGISTPGKRLASEAKEASQQASVTRAKGLDNGANESENGTPGKPLGQESSRIRTRSQNRSGPAGTVPGSENAGQDKGTRSSKAREKKAGLVVQEKYPSSEVKSRSLVQGENKMVGGEDGISNREAPRIQAAHSQDHRGPAGVIDEEGGNDMQDKGTRMVSKTGKNIAELVIEEKCSSNEGKRKLFGQGENRMMGVGEGSISSGGKGKEAIDNDRRQKAIERELRKRRKSR